MSIFCKISIIKEIMAKNVRFKIKKKNVCVCVDEGGLL